MDNNTLSPSPQQAFDDAVKHYDSLPLENRVGAMKLYFGKKYEGLSLEVIDESVAAIERTVAKRETQATLAAVTISEAGAEPQRKAETWEQRVMPVVLKGVSITPVRPDSKAALLPDWPKSATTDIGQIRTWSAMFSNPVHNYAAVATGEPDAVWFMETDSPEVFDRITAETGHDLIAEIPTFLVRSRAGRGHIYFRNTPAALAMGNISQSYVKHGDWSARVHNQYVVGPGSIHPESKLPYTALDVTREILPAPDWLVQWLISQKIEKKDVKGEREVPRNERGLVPHGHIHGWLVTRAGRLRNVGLTVEELEAALLRQCHEECEAPIDNEKIRQVARSFGKYEVGKNYDLLPTQQPQNQQVEEVEVVAVYDPKTAEAWQTSDMSINVMSGRLGELCDRVMLKHFPVAYAWPSVIAAAGVMVPREPVVEGTFLKQADVMTNSYTGLVGPVHSGKSQAIHWATQAIGLTEGFYSDTKAGSSEGLLAKIARLRNSGKIRESVLIDLDEWQHLFSKAGIENSSFTSFLHTAFYKRHQNVVVGRGKEINVDCALSFVGGIVEDEFDACFGANSMGGLHDRFTFGLCPQGFNFIYRPYEGVRGNFTPVPVAIDPEVWEMVEAIRKESPNIGREAEIAVRSALICASFDGANELHAKDAESIVKAMVAEQSRIRAYLRPNAGVTSDAQCANALVSWLARNAGDGKLVYERDVRHGLRKTLERLGPQALDYCTRSLAKQGIISYGPVTNAKPYKGRHPHAYRLIDASGFAGMTYK